MIYLPDTNVFSRFLRGRSEDMGLREHIAQALAECRLSAIALMELEYGAAKSPDVSAFRKRVTALKEIFPAVEAFGGAAAYHAGAVRAFLANLKPNAQPIGPYDVLLAGHALSMGAIFVTRNMGEFARVPGLAVEEW